MGHIVERIDGEVLVGLKYPLRYSLVILDKGNPYHPLFVASDGRKSEISTVV